MSAPLPTHVQQLVHLATVGDAQGIRELLENELCNVDEKDKVKTTLSHSVTFQRYLSNTLTLFVL
jgi:hypothetical protein